jgi:hypothetical protein
MNVPVNFFDEKYNEAISLKKKIDFLWEECEKEKKDCDEVNYETEELEAKIQKLLSSFSLLELLDKETNRPENMIYDVSKIRVSSSFAKKMENFDKKIFELLYGNVFTESYLSKQYGFYNFIYGFSEDKDQNEDIVILEGALMEKKD